MNRKTKNVLLMFPIGAVCGFACGYFIFFGCLVFEILFGRESYHSGDWLALVGLPIFYGIFPGGFLGFIITPVIYFIGFRNLKKQELIKLIIFIGIGTVASGLIGGLANVGLAFLTAIIGFIFACVAAVVYVKDKSAEKETKF